MADPTEPFEFDFSPYSLPTDLVGAIGLVTTAAAQTENCVEELLAGCLGVEFEYGLAVTLHMSMPQRFSVIRSAAEIRLDDLDSLDALDDLLDRAEKAFERRNSVVHHQWCIEPKTGRIYTVKQSARRRLESDVVEMSAAQVAQIAREIYLVGMDVFNFARLHGLLPAFPSTVRPRTHKSRSARKKRREALKSGEDHAVQEGSSPKAFK
jgi:hypothetical protein